MSTTGSVGSNSKQPLRRYAKPLRSVTGSINNNTTTTTATTTTSTSTGSSNSSSPRYYDTNTTTSNNNESYQQQQLQHSPRGKRILFGTTTNNIISNTSPATKNAIKIGISIVLITTTIGIVLWYILLPLLSFILSTVVYYPITSIFYGNNNDNSKTISINDTTIEKVQLDNGTIIEQSIQRKLIYFETTLNTLPTVGGGTMSTIELWPDHHYHTDYHRNDDISLLLKQQQQIQMQQQHASKQSNTFHSKISNMLTSKIFSSRKLQKSLYGKNTLLDQILKNNDTIIEERMMDLYLYDCLPYENSDCQERLQPPLQQQNYDTNAIGFGNNAKNNNNNNQQQQQTITIAILRTPGIIGEVIEEFIITAIQEAKEQLDKYQPSQQNNNKIVIVKTSHIDPDDSGHEVYTRIIRVGVMPILLEAMDLVLRGTGIDYSPSNITIHDIIGTVRQLIRWHKRIVYSAGKDTALLSIPFNKMIAYPNDSIKELLKFMKLILPKYKINNKLMDKLAEKVTHRVDACNAILTKILRETKPSSHRRKKKKHHYNEEIEVNNIINYNTNYHKNYYKINTMVDQVVQEEGQILGTLMDNGKMIYSSSTNSLLRGLQDSSSSSSDNIGSLDSNNNNNAANAAAATLLVNEIVNQPLRGKPIVASRITELIGHFLDRTTKMSIKICRIYTKSLMCLSDTSGIIHI